MVGSDVANRCSWLTVSHWTVRRLRCRIRLGLNIRWVRSCCIPRTLIRTIEANRTIASRVSIVAANNVAPVIRDGTRVVVWIDNYGCRCFCCLRI